MRVFKITLLILAFVFSVSCDRSAEDKFQDSQPSTVVEETEIQPQVVQNSNEPKVEEPASDTGTTEQNFGWNWWMIGTVASLGLNFLLIWLLVKTVNAKDSYRRQRDDIEIGKNRYKKEALRLSSKLDDLEKKKINVEGKLTNSPNPSNPPNTLKKEQTFDDEKPHEVVWPVNNAEAKHISQEITPPVSFFAEKATEDRTFSSVSDQKNEHRSIFKLSLENEQAETAQFEVIDSDFILKMAANSPDTYLYTVCKPENSNQNFTSEIVTTKKGVAHKVDGKWQVKDENKAKIKFQ